MSREDQQIEVDANAEAFLSLLPALLDKGLEGKYALMHKKKIEAILNDFHDCMIVDRLFEGKPFSVQFISDDPISILSQDLLCVESGGRYQQLKPTEEDIAWARKSIKRYG